MKIQKTVTAYLAERERRAKADANQAASEMDILRALPGDLPRPTLSNMEHARHGVHAWLSFRHDYGDDWTGDEVLGALEAAGYVPVAMTFAQYGDWRGSARPGLQEDIPEETRNGKPANSEPLCPLYLVLGTHGLGNEAIAFYRSPRGLLLRVKVPAMGGFFLTARRNEFRGGWCYEKGSAKLIFPDAWHSITIGQGSDQTYVIATVSKQTRGYVETEQGISGVIYFTPYYEQAEFPLTPAQFFRVLQSAT